MDQTISFDCLLQRNISKFANTTCKGSVTVGSKRTQELDSEESLNDKVDSDKIYLIKKKQKTQNDLFH